ncbi:hypothetical protein ABI59_20695 [Acidobacteria bacterium Mor1]|nr:hypothetical protein ABI59_20695 [Acidobacteria bacterium Mor1]
MDIREFVTRNQPEWERLQSYLRRIRSRGLRSFRPEEVRELGMLYRKVSADLATARVEFPGSDIVRLLNDLAVRSHNVVYRAPRRNPIRWLRGLLHEIPETLCRHAGSITTATLLFVVGAMLGALGAAADENIAVMIIGAAWVEKIQAGEYWIEEFFSVTPASLGTASLITNNVGVAIAAYTLGITGLFPTYVMFLNGALLGSVLTLSGQYHLLDRLTPFLFPHGVIEISAILLAGAGGFMVFDGWVHPGDGTRMQGLARGARAGLLVAFTALPVLLVAGVVEANISPNEAIDGRVRIGFGILLGVMLWGWLLSPLFRRRRRSEATAAPAA